MCGQFGKILSLKYVMYFT